MKRKQILGGLIALVIVLAGIFGWRYLNQDHGSKELHIEMQVDGEVVFDDTVRTDQGTLADLLKEMAENGVIQLEYSNSSYGMYIQGLGKDTLYKEDPKAGKYWNYSSENNKQCAKNDFCDAADSLMIEDGDYFIFTLAPFVYE